VKVRRRLARRLDANAVPAIAFARRVRGYSDFGPCECVTVRPLAPRGARIRVTLDLDAMRAESGRLMVSEAEHYDKPAADAHLSGLLREGAL
jgi:hypothetical protein